MSNRELENLLKLIREVRQYVPEPPAATARRGVRPARLGVIAAMVMIAGVVGVSALSGDGGYRAWGQVAGPQEGGLNDWPQVVSAEVVLALEQDKPSSRAGSDEPEDPWSVDSGRGQDLAPEPETVGQDNASASSDRTDPPQAGGGEASGAGAGGGQTGGGEAGGGLEPADPSAPAPAPVDDSKDEPPSDGPAQPSDDYELDDAEDEDVGNDDETETSCLLDVSLLGVRLCV